MLDEATLKRFRSNYHRATEVSEEILTDVLCATYQRITGKKASERLEEAFRQAVSFDG